MYAGPLAVAGAFTLVISPALIVWITGYEPASRQWGPKLFSDGLESSIPLARAPHGDDGAYVLACRTIERYLELAPNYAAPAAASKALAVRAVHAGECININDRAEYISMLQPHHYYRVAIIGHNLACVWSLSYEPGGCFWTASDNLHHIGRGPQLSENQFRDVRVLYAKKAEIDRQRSELIDQAALLQSRQGDRREEAQLRGLADQAREVIFEIERRIAQFQPTEPPPAETNITKPEGESDPGAAWTNL